MSYISIAKPQHQKALVNENIENAIAEFTNAMNKDPNYAEAYSGQGRGIHAPGQEQQGPR